ncbi:MAG: hypothetical protein HY515_01835 [Candidatus Aenigmarchaeota archaeon]|nr:hypothetical protein [Candidatus Aenigmarchaeota archaeon]
MDIQRIKSLVESSEKVAELKKEGFFLSSFMYLAHSLAKGPHSVIVNFYNKQKNELASFNANEKGFEFAGLSPPIKETEIIPLEVDKIVLEADEAMKKCGSKAPEEAISRIVLVLRTSTNSKAETGPTWQVNIFLKNFHVISTVLDAENGEEIASSKMSLSSKL